MDSLEDGALVTNVAGGGQTKTTNETSAHVGQNVTVEVRHDQDLVVVGERVGGHLQAGVVEKLGVELDIGVLLGELAGDAQEEAIGHLHDGGLVHNAHLLAANRLSVLEGISQDTLAGLAGNELDALHNTVHNNVLNTRVLALGVLTDQDGVDIVVGGLEAGNRSAGTEVGEKVECSAESKVERDVALANWGLDVEVRTNYGHGQRRGMGMWPYGERSLEGNLVSLDALNGGVGNSRLSIFYYGIDVDRLPGNWCLY